MKKVFALMMVAGVFAFASCKKNAETAETTADTTVATEVPVEAAPADTAAAAPADSAAATPAAPAPAAH